MINEEDTLSDEELLEVTGGGRFTSNINIISNPNIIRVLYGVQPLYGIRPSTTIE